MPRYFDRITIDFLNKMIKQKIQRNRPKDYYELNEDDYSNCEDKLVGPRISNLNRYVIDLVPKRDLKINFDCENVMIGKTL